LRGPDNQWRTTAAYVQRGDFGVPGWQAEPSIQWCGAKRDSTF
jgi:hypothetical protein